MAEKPAPKQIASTVFDKMTFPDYEYREFPKAIPVVDGVIQPTPYNSRNKAHPVVIVKDQAEWDALKAGSVNLVPVNPDVVQSAERLESEDDVRERLYVEADQAGAKIDKRWSIERIEKAIAEAKKPVL